MSVCKSFIRLCCLSAALLCGALSAVAQEDISSTGATVTSAGGTASFTFGQMACDYGAVASARQGEGVQQVPCQSSHAVEALSGCDSLVWHGRSYRVSLDTVISTYDIYGCDSTVQVSLVVHASPRSEFVDQAADAYLWDDTTLTASGHYTRRYDVGGDCDSVVTLHLALMVGLPLPTIIAEGQTVVKLDHYPDGALGGYVSYPAYQWLRDSNIVSGATSDAYYEKNGSDYAPLSGCYTLVVPTDSTLAFWVHSNTICMEQLAVDPVPGLRFTLFPNPVAALDPVVAQLEGLASLEGYRLAVVDVYGRVVWQQGPRDNAFAFQAPATAGAYTCMIYSPKGVVALRKFIVR